MSETVHINFIAAAYAAAVIVIGFLITWIVLDYRTQRRTLDALEEQGVTRRSSPAKAEKTAEQPKAPAAKEAANKEQAKQQA